jgi:hypothetical protein
MDGRSHAQQDGVERPREDRTEDQGIADPDLQASECFRASACKDDDHADHRHHDGQNLAPSGGFPIEKIVQQQDNSRHRRLDEQAVRRRREMQPRVEQRIEGADAQRSEQQRLLPVAQQAAPINAHARPGERQQNQ